MEVQIDHRTDYHYAAPHSHTVQTLRLWPPSLESQSVLVWSVLVDEGAVLSEFTDAFGNHCATLTREGRHDHVGIHVQGRVHTRDLDGQVAGAMEPMPPGVFLRHTALTPADPAIRALADQADGAGDDFPDRLNRVVGEKLTYAPGETDVATDAARALQAGRGVCQDFAHLFVAAARTRGVPARYVSGYLYDPTGTMANQATHAWAEAWIEGQGWVGYDPTNNQRVGDDHVRLAVGLDYRNAAPVSGTRIGEGAEDLSVHLSVQMAAQASQ